MEDTYYIVDAYNGTIFNINNEDENVKFIKNSIQKNTNKSNFTKVMSLDLDTDTLHTYNGYFAMSKDYIRNEDWRQYCNVDYVYSDDDISFFGKRYLLKDDTLIYAGLELDVTDDKSYIMDFQLRHLINYPKLDNSFNINLTDDFENTALIFAVDDEDIEMLRILVKNGADLNVKNREKDSALNYAIQYNLQEIAEFLIKNGSDVNIKGYNGITPLMNAVAINNKYITKLLISSGANVNARDDEGNPALNYAVVNNNLRGMKYLLKNKADPNIQNNDGNTPLMVTIEYYNNYTGLGVIAYRDIVRLLLQQFRINVNIQNKNKDTALHLLADGGNSDIAEMLIYFSEADKNIENNKELTPFWIAVFSIKFGGYNRKIKMLRVLSPGKIENYVIKYVDNIFVNIPHEIFILINKFRNKYLTQK